MKTTAWGNNPQQEISSNYMLHNNRMPKQYHDGMRGATFLLPVTGGFSKHTTLLQYCFCLAVLLGDCSIRVSRFCNFVL